MSNLRYIGLIPPWEIHFFKRIQGFHQAKPPSLFFVFWGVFWWNLLDLAPGLHLRTYFSSFSKRLRRSARHMTWLLQPTELTAESKPLHLAVSVESSHQTAHKIIALGAQIPDWDLLFFFYFFFLGGEHMPHQLCSTFPPDDHSHPTGGVLSLPGLERREGFLRDWNTPRVITERSGAMLSLFSHQHVRLSVHRRHSKWGAAVWGFFFVVIHASGVNNFWSASEMRWPGRRFLSVVWRPAKPLVISIWWQNGSGPPDHRLGQLRRWLK